MPEVRKLSEGRFWVDYGYHVAPIESRHLGEMEYLALEQGVTSFKIFMFYGGYGLHGKSDQQNQFLMLGSGRPLRHRAFRIRHALGARGHGPPSRTRRPHQRQPALRAGRYPQRLHDDRRARGQADGPCRLQRRAAAAFGRARGLDRLLPRQRNQLHEHQPAASELAQGGGCGLDHAAGLPAYPLPPRSDRRPSPARYRLRMRGACQGQSADPAARGRRGAVAGRARPQDRLDRQRSRLLLGRAEMVEGRSGQHLARQIRFRRHRISALGRGQRGQQARAVVQSHGRTAELESVAALRPAQQRRHRARLRRRHRPGRSARDLHRARRQFENRSRAIRPSRARN